MVDEITQVSESGDEPITVEEAKNFLEVSGTDDDEMIGTLIESARRYIEDYCQVSLTVKTINLQVSGNVQVDLPYYPVDSSTITMEDESANSITNFDRLGDKKPHLIFAGSDSKRYKIAYDTTVEGSKVWKTATKHLTKSLYNNATLEPTKEDNSYMTAIKLIEPYRLH